MKPLAYRIRPKTFDEVVGQDHLVGKNGVIRKMIKKNQLLSIILYGNPGVGKNTIAEIIMSYFPLHSFYFNAASEQKAKLKEIADAASYHENVVVVIDEIHRMKKDIQDFILPFMEKGILTVIGLTTINPYTSVNPAIRSRCHIYPLQKIENTAIYKLIKDVLKNEYQNYPLDEKIINYIIRAANQEIRSSLNMLEAVMLLKNEENTIHLEEAISLLGKPNLDLDDQSDHYFDILSAFQKSIRGSNVNAALHYLARLIVLEDIDIIIRRLLVIAYEDIGLANPNIGPKVVAACHAAKALGFPEARIPLSCITIDLSLSPKSNSSLLAIDSALEDYKNGGVGAIPSNIKNRDIKYHDATYKYPHDYPDALVYQDYLPKNLADKTYYYPKLNGQYERALKEINDKIIHFNKQSKK